jgi:hypothetical protein
VDALPRRPALFNLVDGNSRWVVLAQTIVAIIRQAVTVALAEAAVVGAPAFLLQKALGYEELAAVAASNEAEYLIVEAVVH